MAFCDEIRLSNRHDIAIKRLYELCKEHEYQFSTIVRIAIRAELNNNNLKVAKVCISDLCDFKPIRTSVRISEYDSDLYNWRDQLPNKYINRQYKDIILRHIEIVDTEDKEELPEFYPLTMQGIAIYKNSDKNSVITKEDIVIEEVIQDEKTNMQDSTTQVHQTQVFNTFSTSDEAASNDVSNTIVEYEEDDDEISPGLANLASQFG